MTVWQVWLLIGVPSLALALVCFARSTPRSFLAGIVVLVLGCAGVMTVSPASGAVFAGLLALLYATGGGSGDGYARRS